MLDEARDYAIGGWAVLPLKGKIPLTEHGVNDASSDLDTITSWWEKWPDANVGVATGTASGIFVVDIDPRNGGDTSWSALMQMHPDFEPIMWARTGGGGTHVLFRMPEGRLRGKLMPGIDIKSNGGYIVVAPSIHPETGQPYEWAEMGQLPAAPPWLLDMVRRPERPVREVTGGVDPNDDRPGSRFNAEATWQEILEPAGWTAVGGEGDETIWRRPGKDEGQSATTNYEGSGLLWPFTSSTEFEPDVSYSKFAAYAILNYSGDFAAAAVSLNDRYASTPNVPAAEAAVKVDVPSGGYAFTPAFPEDHFVSKYLAYAGHMTDAAGEYHEAAAMILLASLTRGMKANLAAFPGGLKTNLYLLLAGPSTRSRKSTAQRIALDLLDAVLPQTKLPARITTEAMVYLLAEKRGMPSTWAPDELGVLLAQIYRRDFLRGLEELMLTLYAGDDYTYATVKDTVTVREPHLSILGAATPESVAASGPGAMMGGLLPRFGIVLPATMPTPRPAGAAVDLSTPRNELVTLLRAVLAATQSPGVDHEVKFGTEALAMLNVAESGLTSKLHTARLPAMLYKVAALSALSRAEAHTAVNAADAASAVAVVGRWAKGAANLQPYLRRNAGDQSFEHTVGAVLEALDALGGISARWQVAREVRVQKRVLDNIEATLQDRGLLQVDILDDKQRHWRRIGK